MPNIWNLSGNKILVEIREMSLEILKALTLGHIVWVFVEITNPMIV
jgi:hypothetical protein